MKRKSIHDLGILQRAIMEVLWELGEGTVHQVRDRMRRKKPPAYTTVLSGMQKLEKLGWLQHRVDGRNYVYRPTRSRAKEGSDSLRRFVNRVFEGDSLVVFQHLVEDEKLTKHDLATLRKMIEKRMKGR